ncbi:unnamed protein product [Sphagnum balticum]
MDENLTDESSWIEVGRTKLTTHRHRRKPRCCRALVSSATMADSNAALQARDVTSTASSWQPCNSWCCNSRGYNFAAALLLD